MDNHVIFRQTSDFEQHLPVFLTTAGSWHNQDPIKRPQGFSSYQWFLVLSGEGSLHIDGRTYRARKGQAMVLFPDTPHSYYASAEPWSLIYMAFEGSHCGYLLEQAGIVHSGVWDVDQPDLMRGDMLQLLEASRSDQTESGLECSALLYSFLLRSIRQVQSDRLETYRHIQRLQPVVSYIKHNCHRPLTMDELAGQAGVSPQYLCLLFRKTWNIRPMEFVNRERINRAKQLIYLEPGLKLQEIAGRLGFDNPSYFSTVFKKLEGITPEQFKQSCGFMP